VHTSFDKGRANSGQFGLPTACGTGPFSSILPDANTVTGEYRRSRLRPCGLDCGVQERHLQLCMTEPASRTLTFLFTDIEGSTRLLQALGDGYRHILATQRALIEGASTARGGQLFGSEGDALFLAFTDAAAAIRAAADAQQALATHDWPNGATVRVRMGVHTGQVTALAENYVGLPLHQAARIAAVGHGGQVLVSEATRQLAGDIESVGFRDLGQHRLKDMAHPERLYQLMAPGLDDRFPPLRSLEARPNNLPVQLTSFVGRAEIEGAAGLLRNVRLLTLTGPGGTGKTRLALQLAAELAEDFPDGVFFVALDAVTDAGLVPATIATGLGLGSTTGEPPLERVIDYASNRRMLLVLDNFEQIVAAAPVVGRLLREAPELKVAVTSRLPLRITGEHEFPVPPLALPESIDTNSAGSAMRSEAVRLFVERAMAVQPTFAVTDANAAAVIEIVRRLDGLPLAIELAAARTRTLPVAALLARLDDRLGILVGGARDLPARQQTLRGAIDWSHDLLDEPDRRLFARFSVFAGGARLTEADTVCGPRTELRRDVLDGLSSLADKSLLRAVLTFDEEPRFMMLATIREYAQERLASAGELHPLRRRHAEAFLDVIEGSAGRLTGAGSSAWLDRLQTDADNLRVALDWALELGEAEFALRFVVAIWRFWQIRGHLHEAAERVARVLAMPGVAEQPAELLARAYGAAGSVHYWRAEFDRTHDYYQAALEQARRSGDRAILAEALYNFGFASAAELETQVTRFDGGRPYFEEALAIYRDLGDGAGIASVTWALGLAAISVPDLPQARRYLEESIEIQRAAGDSFGMGWGLHMLGSIDVHDRLFEDAGRRLREALLLFQAAGDQSGIVILLADFAIAARARGDLDLTWRLAGAAKRLSQESGTNLINAPVEYLDWSWPELPENDPAALLAWEEGAALSTDEAIALAIADTTAGEVAAR
jgi:predicted ATPase/class 3 adenylate cyclase